ncbi:MAG: hypothetical protein KAR40_16835 [Candidatus Sabulitectum sp.]|nr:hypothetical protein [Candidatus Sabulitectum sp.]
MKKSRSSGQKRKSPGNSTKSFFSRKKERTASVKKPQGDPGLKNRFVKPPHNPETKYRDQDNDSDTDDNSNDYEYKQRTSRSSGSGCLGSIAGLVKFIVFTILVIAVILIFKCS